MDRVVGIARPRDRMRVREDGSPPVPGLVEREVVARVPAPDRSAGTVDLLNLRKDHRGVPWAPVAPEIDSPPRDVGVEQNITAGKLDELVTVGDRTLGSDDSPQLPRQRADLP